jgi:sugar phosphate permease
VVSTIEAPEVAAPRRRVVVTTFVLTWVAYASYYLGRKNLSVVKTRLATEGITKPEMAAIDTGYLIAYALSQVLSGFLGDRIGARRLIGFGMLASAAACVVFGASSTALMLFVAFTANGLAQATGWPGTNKAIADVTTIETRGRFMGVWSTCYQVGGLVATALATWLLATFGWRQAFFAPAAWIALWGVVVLVALPTGRGALPEPVSPAPPTSAEQLDESPARSADIEEAHEPSLLRLPALYCYAASYFCIKLIRYSLLFWLPFFLHEALHYSEKSSGYLSIGFEVGGIVGTLVFGSVSDRLRHVPRARVAAVGLVGLAAALVVYARAAAIGPLAGFVSLCFVGAFLFGPDSLVGGACAQDLGGSRRAGAAVGIVNGVGSVGAVLQGFLTAYVSNRWGWPTLFDGFVGLALLGAVVLLPTSRATR